MALRAAIDLWAASSTHATTRKRDELLVKKRKAVQGFFNDVGKAPGDVSPTDVARWCQRLVKKDGRRAAAATIYARVSFLSSFYTWAQRDPTLSQQVQHNPAHLARPRAPRPYQSESAKAWTDDELQRLVRVLQHRASGGDLVGKRDLALLLLYTSTGMRREEVIGLRGKDVHTTADGLVIGGRIKGGRYQAREVRDPEVTDALLDYLRAAHRLHVLKTDAPLWTRHDQPKLAGAPLSSHAFARNLKRYARAAGLDHAHIHQTRHTYARIVAEETGSYLATQEALDHASLATTTVYVQRITVKRDQHSRAVARRRARTAGPAERGGTQPEGREP
jgi:integrase